MSDVSVHLTSNAGYVHAHRVDVTVLPEWIEHAQTVCPNHGITIMSIEESARTLDADIARNSALMRAACNAKS